MWLRLCLLSVVCFCSALAAADFDPEEYYVHGPSDEQEVEKTESQEVPTAEIWPSTDLKLGQVSGIGVDSKGDVHVFHRGSRVWDDKSFDENNRFAQKAEGPIKEHTHLQLDQNTGAVISQRGANRFYMPHGLTVDHEDNIWLTDVGLHQVFKFAAGKDEPSLVLGVAFEPGTDEKHFCKPTDVAVATNGDFFVSDGYCNSRIVKFMPDGKFITSFGKPSENHIPAPVGTFFIPHSLTLIEDWNILCVADRENKRIQCFSAGLELEKKRGLPTGTFIRKAENLGRVYSVRSKDHFLVGVTNAAGHTTGSDNQLFVVNLENGKAETFNPGLQNPHDIAVAADGTIYVGEMGPNRIVKIAL